MAGEGAGVAGWRDAESAPKVSVQVALVDEAGESGDCHGRDPCFEEASGAHDALASLERVGWHAGDLSELSDEVELGDVGYLREFVERHVLGEAVLEMLCSDSNGGKVRLSLRAHASCWREEREVLEKRGDAALAFKARRR